MKRVLITRTRPDADETAERVAALGLTPVLAPMLFAEQVASALPARPAGLVFTSRQAVRLARLPRAWLDLPVWTVGAATAEAAHLAGFALIENGGGDGAALAETLKRVALTGPLLWLRGADIAFDLAAHAPLLQAIVYRTQPSDTVPPHAEAVLFHSARAAEIFTSLARAAAWADAQAFALSASVAEPLRAFGFAALHVAAAPTESALIDKLAQTLD